MSPLTPPASAQPSTKSRSIAWKIWLSIAITLGGFLIVILQTSWMEHYNEEKHHLVTDYFFPAALRAQQISFSSQAQLNDLDAAIATAEPNKIKSAASHTENIIKGLEYLASLPELPAALTETTQKNLSKYQHFASQAFPIYTRILENPADKSLFGEAKQLHHLSMNLTHSFTLLSTAISELASKELQCSTTISRQQNSQNLLVLLITFVFSSLLVAYTLTRSIIIPLKKTVLMANMMATGNFSQKLDIKQNDEIGELAHAMNTMSRQLQEHYQELEERVDDKTLTLQETNRNLSVEIRRRKDTQFALLNSMQEAEKANRAKGAFLAMMSHELRTPMNGIIGMSSLALDTTLNDTQRRYLTTIRDSSESLLTILNDILDFSTMETDKLELEAVDFEPRTLMDDISERLSIRTLDKGLDFCTLTDPSIPDRLKGDASRLQQVMLNLAGNAIKFTESGEVAMRMEAIKNTGQTVTIRFAISDTGIGIPQDRLEHLFEPFTQADISSTRKFGGTGLGLSISKRLVELMGGRIKAESSEGEGSTFWFTATFAISDHAVDSRPGTRDHSLIYHETKVGSPLPASFQATGKRILVADDDNTNLVAAQAILASFGCLVHVAHNGREALDRLQVTDYDLILMDIDMPVTSGLEATAIIKGWSESSDKDKQNKSQIPIIALTSDTSERALQKYRTAGMEDYLEKPLRSETLTTCLKKWLASSSNEKEFQTGQALFSKELLLKRLNNDHQKLTELTLGARIAIPRYLSELNDACTTNNCQQATQICDEIKKMAATLRIAPLQHEALHLCLAMKNADTTQTSEHYQNLKSILSELLQCLAK